jgi:hypothetical protein
MQPLDAWESPPQEGFLRFVAFSMPLNAPRTICMSTVEANPVIAVPILLGTRTRVRRRRRKRSWRAPGTSLLPMLLVSGTAQIRGRS